MKTNKIIPIKPKLRKLIDEFLNFEEYYPIFKQFASVVGYHGNDMTKVKKILFMPDEETKEIGFTISGMEELLLEFQLIKQLIDKEPYKSLLKEYPEAIQNIRLVSTKMLHGEDIGEEDLVLMFDTNVYDKTREKIDTETDKSSQ